MKSSTVERWRAYLLIASMIAMAMQVAVFVSIIVFNVPDTVFTKLNFRVVAVVVLVCGVYGVQRLARGAFMSALASRHITRDENHERTVWLSTDCPHLPLVILHLRLNRARYDAKYL
ncbi:hypothetical protein [Burkholderia pyrrocinia]|uniref:hypothetical protein n=1 Tax=Burkholderia pyrrocinia TaxID=60550 RepID=UPI002AB26A51|nr:hypothetical protein [Burkholderia pyrrocinia]